MELCGTLGSIRDALADDEDKVVALFCFLKDTGLHYQN